jgi:hypothetical protein
MTQKMGKGSKMETNAEAVRDLLLTSRGRVIGPGRFKVPRTPKLGFDCEIPLLSFIVTKSNDNDGYIATCIHMQIDGYGKTEENAINDMADNVCYFLHENFKDETRRDSTWNNILDVFLSSPLTSELWDAYHTLQIELAKKGISTDWYSKLLERIISLEKRVSKEEYRFICGMRN